MLARLFSSTLVAGVFLWEEGGVDRPTDRDGVQ